MRDATVHAARAALAVCALVSLSGCSMLRGSHHDDIVVLMRIGSAKELAPPVFETRPASGPQASHETIWTHVALSAPGLSGGLSLLAPDPSAGGLAPDARRVTPPDNWSRSWLRWPAELAATPEQLTWAPDQLEDLPSGRTLHLAAFDAQRFDAEGRTWSTELPPELQPENCPWIVIDLPRPPPTSDVDPSKPAIARNPFHAVVRWFGPKVENARVDALLAGSTVAENLSRLAAGRRLVPVEFVAPDSGSTAFDLWIFVQGGRDIEFVDLELRTPDQVLGRRSVGFEDIDGFADDGPGVQRLQLAVSEDGDGAVYSLASLQQGVWLESYSEFRAGGILGVPFFAGPSGQSLGVRRLQIKPGSDDFFRIFSRRAPDLSNASSRPAGIHLWLVPRSSDD